MSHLIPFSKCIARPNDQDRKYPLENHLANVCEWMKNWTDDPHIKVLLILAGLCHDMTKAHIDWQKYIKGIGTKGPAHAPSGAFLFSYLAYQYLEKEKVWEKYCREWLWLLRDIADHHSHLHPLSDMNWVKQYEWAKIDVDGYVSFLNKYIPHLYVQKEQLSEWVWRVDEIVEEVLHELDTSYQESHYRYWMSEIQRWRHYTTALISGDRFDVKSICPAIISVWQRDESLVYLQKYCAKKNLHPMSSVRQQAKEKIIDEWRRNHSSRFYTVNMPTGYGKTIASLYLALEMLQTYDYKKIIYVAPYLSIIEQTAKTIEEALNQNVLQHHSLSMLKDDKKRLSLADDEDRLSLAIEAWANGIVCTSFQQWTRAMFPKRAQHALRRSFLEKSVIIIDEPQIFQPEGWNVFLLGLEAMVERYDLRVIFLSATMPPFQYGLSQPPISLSVQATEAHNRYKVKRTESMDEKQAAMFLSKCNSKSKAMILNTIEDAYRVYKEIKSLETNVYLLHGLMIPIHKQAVIKQIQYRLLEQLPTTVISTQIIEAGVDVSFETVVRANAILPSIVQAAGRVNRHLEKEKGLFWIMPFYRGGEMDTRHPIYDRFLTSITDEILMEKETWTEFELTSVVQKYYEKMFAHNTYEATKRMIQEAYEGNWNKLSEYEPFGKDYLRLPLFVDWDWEEYIQYVSPDVIRLMQHYDVHCPMEVYEKFQDQAWLKRLSFEERKRFMILVHAFVVNVPIKYALKVASKEQFLQKRIPLLEDTEAYHPKLGLTFSFDEQFDCII
ncbi:MAG: CRISPR-associated helicase/endonuclease Cas3 [Anoxybacillus sp.]|nr:MAG: CRISPR-associated helicase/endonuclease Cas3 [Anoxybacillus sp.]